MTEVFFNYYLLLLIVFVFCYYSPTVKDTLRSLTDIYRGQGRMEDAAKLERLSRQSSSERAQGELLFSQLLDEVEAANTGNVKANTSPKKVSKISKGHFLNGTLKHFSHSW